MSFLRKQESTAHRFYWMLDQVQHDELGLIIESLNLPDLRHYTVTYIAQLNLLNYIP